MLRMPWLEHAQAAIEGPGLCTHCTRFTAKSLRRQLACQVSLSEKDPVLTTSTTKQPQLSVVEKDITKMETQHWGSTSFDELLDPLT